MAPVDVAHPDVDVGAVRLRSFLGPDQVQDHLVPPRVGLAEVGVAAGEHRRDHRQPGQLRPERLRHRQVVDVDDVALEPPDPVGARKSVVGAELRIGRRSHSATMIGP